MAAFFIAHSERPGGQTRHPTDISTPIGRLRAVSLGPGEILLCLFVALVVLGPDQLPKAARSVGRALGEFRKFNNALQAQMNDFINAEDVLKDKKGTADDAGSGAHAYRPPDPTTFKPVDQVVDTRPFAPPSDAIHPSDPRSPDHPE